jgi:hypothetical protein
VGFVIERIGKTGLMVNVTGNGGTLQNHTVLRNLLRFADEAGGCDRSRGMLKGKMTRARVLPPLFRDKTPERRNT